MDIGIPHERSDREHRVALAPSGVHELVDAGHAVWIESGAGSAAGFDDLHYERAGARIAFSHEELYRRSELVVAVDAPDGEAREWLGSGQTVVAFWTLPTARPETVARLIETGVTAIGMETIEEDDGVVPVLVSTSEIAGRIAVILASGLMLKEFGGRGTLFTGVPGVPPASFVILGAGTLGRTAAEAAIGLGAHVVLLDRNVGRLREASHLLPRPVPTLVSTRRNLEKVLAFADVVLGAAGVHGQRAPRLVSREMLGVMKPGALVMDLAVDMGGVFESSRPAYFPDPVYEVDGIRHLSVPNVASLAPRSATVALTNAVLPYLLELARDGADAALGRVPALARGTYLHGGHCRSPRLAELFDLEHRPLAGNGS